MTINTSDGNNSLSTVTWVLVGPSARLALAWSQTSSGSVTTRLAIWLTLRGS